VLADGTRISAPVVVNVAGPHSSTLSALAGVQEEFRVTTRPLRQEVHVIPAPPGFSVDEPSPFVSDGDLGIYYRPAPGGQVLVGGMEAECDPLEWVDDPDAFDVNPTAAVYETYTTRLARRMPELRVPSRPSGIAGLYDVTGDWIPIYDRTSVDGFYVAIGTSGNQFKNAPVVGQLMAALIDAVESGHDHDAHPLVLTAPRTGNRLDLATYSRLRTVAADAPSSVMG
jgi:sarcosine oxidase subunit beta